MSRNERRALIAAAAAIGLSMTPADAARLVEPTGFAEMRQLVDAHPEIDQAIFPGLSAAPLLMGGKKNALKSQDVFNTSLWTGNWAADRAITTGIDSDEGSLVWVKNRSSASYSHILTDTVRGANFFISSDASYVQATSPWLVRGFSSSGYVIGDGSQVNNDGQLFVGWQFRRAPKFFDIVQYAGNGVAGRQIAHNLGVKPGVVIVKRLDSAAGWFVSHRSYSSTDDYQRLETTDPVNNVSGIFGTHSSTTFGIGNNAVVNASGGTYIAYIFAHDPSPEGIIQCGSYVGNGSSTGPVVNLGWRPQYVLWKRATGADGWFVQDVARGANYLNPNTADAEGGGGYVTILSNGFQPNITNGFVNQNGQTYIYMAIREAA